MEWPVNPWTLFYGLIFVVWAQRSVQALKMLWGTPPLPNETVRTFQNPPFVSIIVPAKNEETNIGSCLKSLLSQEYPDFEIVVANDNSTDSTLKIIEEMRKGSSQLSHLNVPPTPQRWTGKNFALHSAAALAKGDWFLFTDADTRHEPAALSQVMHQVLSQNLDFLTLLPRCLTASFLEHLIQPCAMSFIGLWFPMEKINDPHSKMHFANGQFLLIRRSMYETLGGHSAVREEFLEDFALIKKTKESGGRAKCMLGVNIFGTRMYDSAQTIWRGWRRIYLHAFRKNFWHLLLKAADVFVFSVLPFAAIFFVGNNIKLPLATILFILLICATASSIVKAKKIYALLHPLAALWIVGILLDAAKVAATKGETKWR
ncbi:MAG: glycosyltransferase [Candidatus Omnitrophica bacterium]|nr:glycosyltransferase [Candidatus Omnitrophota bacterium]